VRFSHAWLLEHVALEEPPEEIGRRLTGAGLPLDGIERRDPADPRSAVYDFDILTNRPDCMSHVGLAREAAALFGRPLEAPAPRLPAGGPATDSVVSIAIEEPDLCRRYSARGLMGVAVAESPRWLRSRLESIGQRPINNVVDATNFVLWELGQPLHPFDLDQVAGRRIIVRRARPGETLVTLDGVTRRLEPDMLVIADARGPIAVAGIMGGKASEIGPSTRNVLLESAWFDPKSVRRTSKTLGLHTEASHRFERGSDPEATVRALDQAAALIVELAGGRPTDPPVDQHPSPEAPRRVPLRPERVPALLGYDPGKEAMRSSLAALGFQVDERDAARWQVGVPSFRRDVEREVDLIEEVARHRGYEAIPSRLPLLPDDSGGRSADDRLDGRIRAALLAAGLSEAINFSMGDRDEMLALAAGHEPIPIENPLQSQAAYLRTSLLPGLLRNLAHNLNHGATRCHLFEIGRVFSPGGQRPAESDHLAAVLAGRGQPDHWSLPRREVDLFDARGAIEVLAERLGVSSLRFTSDRIGEEAPVSGLRVAAGGSDLGVVGEVAAQVLRRFGVDGKVYAFELDLAALRAAATRVRTFASLPRFPPMRRDLALLVQDGTAVTEIEEVVRTAGRLPIAGVEVFDRYRGPGIASGCASVAIQVIFQHPERTLEAAEVQAAQDAIVTELRRRLGVTLRKDA
jgi:phenylalanyl-tRNA synthetase beta chain